MALWVDRVLVQRDRQLDQEIGQLARKRRNRRLWGGSGSRRCGWRGRRSGRLQFDVASNKGYFFTMSPDTYSTRWRVLALLGFSELLGMSLWFSASAVTPQLRSIWGLTTSEAAWLTTIVQFGFVCGTAVAAVLNLADLIPAGRFFSVCALLGALA